MLERLIVGEDDVLAVGVGDVDPLGLEDGVTDALDTGAWLLAMVPAVLDAPGAVLADPTELAFVALYGGHLYLARNSSAFTDFPGGTSETAKQTRSWMALSSRI